ncbi:hypothetical protein GCM10027071_14360 [Microbacterium marinum]
MGCDVREDQQMGESRRVFEIAQATKTDVKTVLHILKDVGVSASQPEQRVDGDAVDAVYEVLGHRPTPALAQGGGTGRSSAPKRQPTQTYRGGVGKPAALRPLPRHLINAEREAAIRQMIPLMFSDLAGSGVPIDEPVVVYHDVAKQPEYGLVTLDGRPWMPPGGSGVSWRQLVERLRTIDRPYRDRGLMPGNAFVLVDVRTRRAQHAQSLKRLRNGAAGPAFDALTLEETPAESQLPAGAPARLAPRAQTFHATDVPHLVGSVTSPADGPEEAFLLHEELLALAVDSLEGDEKLDSLPVHINALWVFARPVIMRRPNGTERHVRAVWYRQGAQLWRMRTFAAGRGHDAKEVGERLSGRLPFVPVWDETRPEQKLLAAVWALMAQGGVTESERHATAPESPVPHTRDGGIVVVRVQAGTSHASVYRADGDGATNERPAWSVRGHWRKQPYPSLGRDSEGAIVSRMIWIASYTKGSLPGSASDEKVIVVRP